VKQSPLRVLYNEICVLQMLYFTVKKKKKHSSTSYSFFFFFPCCTWILQDSKDSRHNSKSCVGSRHRIYGSYGMSWYQNISARNYQERKTTGKERK
jgi:hypothetical protein